MSDKSVCSGCWQDCENVFLLGNQQVITDNALWQREWFSARYIPPLPAALHEWKHRRNVLFSEFFQMIMLNNPPVWLADTEINALLPMPMSTQRRLLRGFNQCDELVNALSTRYGWRVLPQTAVFRQHKMAQSTLNKKDRLDNIRDVFRIEHNVCGLNLLIIDDLMTTGATLTELTRSLKNAGAEQIYIWVVARKF